jgi:ankyrin repeat protein
MTRKPAPNVRATRFFRPIFGNVTVLVLSCLVLALAGGRCLAQAAKDSDADDEKTKRNKALNTAASLGKLDQIKELLKQGADPNWRDPMGNGKTAMVRAVMSGKLETVKLLIENRVDVHAPDGSGRYPVYFCCIGQNAALLKYLLDEQGCAKDLKLGPAPMLGSICDHGQAPAEFISIVVKAGADPDEFKGTVTPLIAALQLDPKVRKPEIVRSYVKALIECKADVNLRDKREKMSPLQWAKKRGDAEIIEMLEKAGAKE